MSREDAMRFIPATAALDTDQNGELTADEIANASASLMKLDQNGDGTLTAEELLPKGPPPGGGPGGQGGRGRGPGQGGQGGQGQGGRGQGGGERPKRPE